MRKHLLLDTNILVYLTAAHSMFKPAAQEAVKREIQKGAKLYVTMQILREYAKVMTGMNDPQTGALYGNMTATLEAIRQFRERMTVIGDNAQSFERWLAIVEKYGVHGRAVFDAQIAAQMLQNNITHILTNDERFSRYGDVLTVISLGELKT